MYFEINVTLNRRHFFATAERSILNQDKAEDVYNVFKEKFPESEGYKVTVTRWEKSGRTVNMDGDGK